MKVSKYVSYNEVIFSQTAIKNKIDNTPSEAQLTLIKALATTIFDPLREWVGGPIQIVSGFRGKTLNTKIGGSSTSQHCVGTDPKLNSYGAAFDIDDTFGYKTNKEMFHYIKDNFNFDQLIYEYGTIDNPDWLHVSYRPDGRNRKEILKATKVKGKTLYSIYK